MRYYKIGSTWIVSMRWRYGLIHLGSAKWWKPIVQFPLAAWEQFRFAKRGAP